MFVRESPVSQDSDYALQVRTLAGDQDAADEASRRASRGRRLATYSSFLRTGAYQDRPLTQVTLTNGHQALDMPLRSRLDMQRAADTLQSSPHTRDEDDPQMNLRQVGKWRSKLMHPRVLIPLHPDDGHATGYAFYHDGTTRDGQVDLHSIRVASSMRGHGLGSALIDHLKDRALHGQDTPRELHVYNMVRPAGPFYAANGFDVDDRSGHAQVPSEAMHRRNATIARQAKESPRYEEIHPEHLSTPDGRRSRKVTPDEFQDIAHRGHLRYRQLSKHPDGTRGLDDNFGRIIDHGYKETRKPWGGMTINARTGQKLPDTSEKDLFAMTVRDPGMDTISVPEGGDKDQFTRAMHHARATYGHILARPQHHLGLFHDNDKGTVDIDPVFVTPSAKEAEEVGTYTRNVGGAYNYRDGLGYWPAHTEPAERQAPEVNPRQAAARPMSSTLMRAMQARRAQQGADEPITVAGAAVLAEDTGRVLLIQRSNKDQDDPARGLWEIPGGHLEDGETPDEAAMREWSEETGVPFPQAHLEGTWTSNGLYRGHWFTVPSEGDVEINPQRGRVLNPDDPDHDDIEVVGWWEPGHLLAANKALRPEFIQGLDRPMMNRVLRERLGRSGGSLTKHAITDKTMRSRYQWSPPAHQGRGREHTAPRTSPVEPDGEEYHRWSDPHVWGSLAQDGVHNPFRAGRGSTEHPGRALGDGSGTHGPWSNLVPDPDSPLHREMFRSAAERMQRQVSLSHPVVAIRTGPLRSALRDGRLKSQFETNTSFGGLNTHMRQNVEQGHFGYPEDADTYERYEGVRPSHEDDPRMFHPRQARPIYGYLARDPFSNRKAKMYGQHTLVLHKPSVWHRTTFTQGDSIGVGGQAEPAPVQKVTVHAYPRDAYEPDTDDETDGLRRRLDFHVRHANPDDRSVSPFADSSRGHGARYTEAQYHGGVLTSDIHYAILRGDHDDPELRSLKSELDRQHIPWVHHDQENKRDRGTITDRGRYASRRTSMGPDSKIVAQQDHAYLIRHRDGTGQVADVQQGILFDPAPLDSILARGYWGEPDRGTSLRDVLSRTRPENTDVNK